MDDQYNNKTMERSVKPRWRHTTKLTICVKSYLYLGVSVSIVTSLKSAFHWQVVNSWLPGSRDLVITTSRLQWNAAIGTSWPVWLNHPCTAARGGMSKNSWTNPDAIWGHTSVSTLNHILDAGAHWCHLVNTVEWSVHAPIGCALQKMLKQSRCHVLVGWTHRHSLVNVIEFSAVPSSTRQQCVQTDTCTYATAHILLSTAEALEWHITFYPIRNPLQCGLLSKFFDYLYHLLEIVEGTISGWDSWLRTLNPPVPIPAL